MKICVIGMGYIGLPTSAMFANAGHQVIGVDVNPRIVEALNKGEIIIEEPGLADFVKAPVASGNLKASTTVEHADAYIIAVPTPFKDGKKADMKYVESATKSVATVLQKGDLVILESTSPVGTTDELMKGILEEATGLKAGEDFGLGHSPERVIPGNILYELVNNHRVAGGIDKASAARIAELYKSFVKGQIFETDSRTAEMCKLSENTFRDVNIAFANELAKICEAEGINFWELREISNKHPRVNIHQAGPGVGGHCIAIDPWFIVERQPEIAQIIGLSRRTNDSMPAYTKARVQGILEGSGAEKGAKIAVLGVTYKPDVDDMRESPITELVEELSGEGYQVQIHDPFVGPQMGYEPDLLKVCEGASLVILAVNHKQYKDIDWAEVGNVTASKLIFDTRNFVDAEAAKAAGFRCFLLGKSGER